MDEKKELFSKFWSDPEVKKRQQEKARKEAFRQWFLRASEGIQIKGDFFAVTK